MLIKTQRAACSNTILTTSMAIFPCLLICTLNTVYPSNYHMKEWEVTIILCDRSRQQRSAVSAFNQDVQSQDGEALWLGSFSHRAPTAPLCRGKTNTEPFTPRQAITWQDRQPTISLSEIHFERYSTCVSGYSDCETNTHCIKWKDPGQGIMGQKYVWTTQSNSSSLYLKLMNF